MPAAWGSAWRDNPMHKHILCQISLLCAVLAGLLPAGVVAGRAAYEPAAPGWTAPVPLASDDRPSLQSEPAVAIAGDRTVAGWVDSRNAVPDLYAVMWAGDQPGAETRVTHLSPHFDAGSAVQPAFAVEPGGACLCRLCRWRADPARAPRSGGGHVERSRPGDAGAERLARGRPRAAGGDRRRRQPGHRVGGLSQRRAGQRLGRQPRQRYLRHALQWQPADLRRNQRQTQRRHDPRRPAQPAAEPARRPGRGDLGRRARAWRRDAAGLCGHLSRRRPDVGRQPARLGAGGRPRQRHAAGHRLRPRRHALRRVGAAWRRADAAGRHLRRALERRGVDRPPARRWGAAARARRAAGPGGGRCRRLRRLAGLSGGRRQRRHLRRTLERQRLERAARRDAARHADRAGAGRSGRRVRLVWQDARAGNQDIFSATWQGSGWAEGGRINADAARSPAQMAPAAGQLCRHELCPLPGRAARLP